MQNRITRISTLFIILLTSFIAPAGNLFDSDKISLRQETPPENFSTHWVDSVFHSLSLEQRIAQLLMIEVHTNQNRTYYNQIERLIKNYNIGGIVFFRGGPARQLSLTNQWQRMAQTPMLLAMDAEWGLSMRLDSTVTFPRQITLGAITNERLIYELGLEMGRQSRRMGMHINFSPVVDVNSNPRNPVINSRSFGECRYNVTRKGLALMFGMQDAGIMATAKHFPGHGDTDVDSHHALPLINHPYPKLDSIHLFPFRHLVEKGILGVMVAHLNVPSLKKTQGLPSSLSEEIVTDLLQKEMGFKGLIITDALNMKGVTDTHKAGQAEVAALLAGNDILLMPDNVPGAIRAIKQALENNIISEAYMNLKVKKVLYHKELMGLNQLRVPTLNNLHNDLNAPRVHQMNRRLAEAAITLIENKNDLIPLKRLDTLRIAALSIGSSTENPFQAMMANYAPTAMYAVSKNHSAAEARNILEKLSDYNLVVISIQNNSMFPGRNYGINASVIELVETLISSHNVILNIFANPYSLGAFSERILDASSIVVSYQDGRDFEEASAQVIFGAIPARGKLPVSVLPYFPMYAGINTQGGLRIKFGEIKPPGINLSMLNRIDSIVNNGIENHAFPGCQIAVIKDGILVYHQSFGHHTYDKKRPVKNNDIYDLASLTKVLATTAAIMKLYDQGVIDIDKPLSQYIPFLLGSNKQNILIREILAHQARLRSWIPFYLHTLEEGRPSIRHYSNVQTIQFPVRVAGNLYLHQAYRDSILHFIRESELLPRKRYLYSDLGFILFSEMISLITGQPFEQYIHNEFLRPLGLQNMDFNPLDRFPSQRIVPTENDTIFRRQLIHGYVHDPGAGMMGGVAGHAGLFSNAADVAVFMQMFLQNGQYGGKVFFSPETVKEFTTTQFAGNQNRRALGFDKPDIRPNPNGPAAESASAFSFGHSGFTGTYAWADPHENMVYVFLSNRVNPSASNRKISEMKIRTNIHQAIYDAIYYERFMLNNRLP